jgi:SAM-dependent methyltransferase
LGEELFHPIRLHGGPGSGKTLRPHQTRWSHIDLVPIKDLSKPAELRAVEADSFDLVLFSEIIEHITFNPVELWREIYRVLRPGGRIVITTPNYYSPYSRAWSFSRFMQGFGGGISVDEILTQHTYSHGGLNSETQHPYGA